MVEPSRLKPVNITVQGTKWVKKYCNKYILLCEVPNGLPNIVININYCVRYQMV